MKIQPKRTKTAMVVLLTLLTALVALTTGVTECETNRLRHVSVAARPTMLHVVKLQEGSNGVDNPYFGAIKFSAEFGVPNSTEVEFIDRRAVLDPVSQTSNVIPPLTWGEGIFGHISDLVRNAADALSYLDSGEEPPGPNEAGFPTWLQDELEFGARYIPEDPNGEGVSIDGVLLLAMEGDSAGWEPWRGKGVREILRTRAQCLETALRAHVEPTPWSVFGLLGALQLVQEDVDSGCSGGAPDGVGSISEEINNELWIGPDRAMGTAFVVRLGVPADYYSNSVKPLLSRPRSVTCDDGSEEFVEAGCAPFLANPCAMKTETPAISQFASICPAGRPTSGVGSRYETRLGIPLVRTAGGEWIVNFATQPRDRSGDGPIGKVGF